MKKGFAALEFCCASIFMTFFIISSISIIFYLYSIIDVNLLIQNHLTKEFDVKKLEIDNGKYRLVYSEDLTNELLKIKTELSNELQNRNYEIKCMSLGIYEKYKQISASYENNCELNNKSNKDLIVVSLKFYLPEFVAKNLLIIGINPELKIEKYIKLIRNKTI